MICITFGQQYKYGLSVTGMRHALFSAPMHIACACKLIAQALLTHVTLHDAIRTLLLRNLLLALQLTIKRLRSTVWYKFQQ
jgi:hypothetical protein